MSRALKVLEKGGLVHLGRLASVLLITASQLLGPLLCAAENAILLRQAGDPLTLVPTGKERAMDERLSRRIFPLSAPA